MEQLSALERELSQKELILSCPSHIPLQASNANPIRSDQMFLTF